MAVKDEAKDPGTVMGSGWRIARETSKSEYSWDSERSGKTGTVYDRNSAE